MAELHGTLRDQNLAQETRWRCVAVDGMLLVAAKVDYVNAPRHTYAAGSCGTWYCGNCRPLGWKLRAHSITTLRRSRQHQAALDTIFASLLMRPFRSTGCQRGSVRADALRVSSRALAAEGTGCDQDLLWYLACTHKGPWPTPSQLRQLVGSEGSRASQLLQVAALPQPCRHLPSESHPWIVPYPRPGSSHFRTNPGYCGVSHRYYTVRPAGLAPPNLQQILHWVRRHPRQRTALRAKSLGYHGECYRRFSVVDATRS
ncbi:hypothetical protein B0H67DRAFT_311347 [Lasiosphaeris hirsuta]|uniref:Uncharacterized protein n=1 Tax=Lasiosphaeris hirsuta TaxID=260670 RepID=A0AA40A1E5_9PEZI|nr:hypothetical protein B0H67DRAFT_390768 [Lasiosphaeris hirsuta]KAK0707445.1 hypothetical protein B0H67DRAFT_311347 [Lasiosphaeris hirsuta]